MVSPIATTKAVIDIFRHLGTTPETIPAARGFDRSYSLLPGGASHYAWEPDFADADPQDEVRSYTNGCYLTGRQKFKSFQPSHYDARNKYTEDTKFFSM